MTSLADKEFRRFFEAQKHGLLRYLTMRLGNIHEAEEVLQEAFIRFLRASETMEVQNRHALLVRICSTQAIDRIRQNASRSNREREWGAEYYRAQSDGGDPGSVSASQERQISAREDIQAVVKALDSLSETVRTAFILHRFEGLTHGQVAARMGLARSTVEKHIIKASKHLVRRLPRNQGTPGN